MKPEERGQSVVELALLLPLLVLIAIGVVEVGYAMRNYMVVGTAAREGIRFAARGRFTDMDIARQAVTAGGMSNINEGTPFLRTSGSDPNTGIIITHIPVRDDGTVISKTVYVTGTICLSDTRAIETNDSRVTIDTVVSRTVQTTINVNDLRESEGYERLDSEVVFLELFYCHDTLWASQYVPAGPWPMYIRSSMRVVSDSRQWD